jgi:hypothetical protein
MINEYVFKSLGRPFGSSNGLCLLKPSPPPYYDGQPKDWTNFCYVIVIYTCNLHFSFLLQGK